MVGNESQRLEKGDWVPYIAHDNGSQPTYSNSPHLQRAIRVKAEDIPIPSIEDAPSCGPPHFFFVLPKLHAIRLCVRILAILVTVTAVVLILVAIALYNKAKAHVLTFQCIGRTDCFIGYQVTF
jgi:hypothetical protein